MVFLYVKGQGETLFPLGREDPICKGGKKHMKKKTLKRIVSLLLGALLLLGCALPAGALTLDLEKNLHRRETDGLVLQRRVLGHHHGNHEGHGRRL